MKKLACILLLLPLLAAFAACSGDGAASSATGESSVPAASSAGGGVAAAPLGRADTPDTLGNSLDFGGATVRIPYRSSDYIKAELIAASETGEIINDAVYRRNLSVEERLNVKLKFFDLGAGIGDADKTVVASVMAGSDDYDLFAARFYDTAMNHYRGYYRDVAGAPYLDFGQPWWFSRLMKNVAIGEDKIFMMLGEISQSSMLSTCCVYFNKDMYARVKGGDPAGVYESVLDGSFTVDRLAEAVKGVYSDVNGDGKADFESDVFGIYLGTASTAQYFVYSTGASFTKRDENNIATLDLENRGVFTMFDKAYGFFNSNPDAHIFTGDVAFNESASSGFAAGRALFMPYTLRAAGGSLRVMEEDFGMLPMPKYDESVEDYTSFIQPSQSVYTIPVTTKIFDAACAALEAMCAETYRTVTPVIFDIALKDKYLRDDVSSRMLDLIVASSNVEFITAYFSSGASAIASDLFRQVTSGPDLASLIASKKGAAQAALDEIIKYYTENG